MTVLTTLGIQGITQEADASTVPEFLRLLSKNGEMEIPDRSNSAATRIEALASPPEVLGRQEFTSNGEIIAASKAENQAIATLGTIAQQPEILAQTYRYPVAPGGDSTRRVQPQQLTTLQVVNRTSKTIQVEIVGLTAPISLSPRQTRSLQVDPCHFSILYWVPNGSDSSRIELNARVSQPSDRIVVVELSPSRFPTGNLALYMPEPSNPIDTLRIF
jgi:hypothetical protein